MKHFITAFALALSATMASGATISTETIDDLRYITFKGKIIAGDEIDLEETIIGNPDIEWISWDSTGGLSWVGRSMSNLMGEYLMSSRVEKGNSCMSACATAFIGGDILSVEGKLGFHSFRVTDYDGTGRIRMDKEEITDIIYENQSQSALEMYNILKNGFTWDLYYDYTYENGKFITFNNNDELKKYYIGDIKFSKEYIHAKTKEFKIFKEATVATIATVGNNFQRLVRSDWRHLGKSTGQVTIRFYDKDGNQLSAARSTSRYCTVCYGKTSYIDVKANTKRLDFYTVGKAVRAEVRLGNSGTKFVKL